MRLALVEPAAWVEPLTWAGDSSYENQTVVVHCVKVLGFRVQSLGLGFRL